MSENVEKTFCGIPLFYKHTIPSRPIPATATDVIASMQNVVNLKTDRVLLDNSIVEHANQLIEKYGNVEFEMIFKLGTDGECFPLTSKIL